MLEQLIHNGVLVYDPPEARGLVIQVRGEAVLLDAKQEEMAVAWAKKQGTDYVQDEVFVQNFMTDFSQALGFDEALSVDEVDFGAVIEAVEAEKRAKKALSEEEKKAQREARKAEREALQEQYGYAIVNGQEVELANYAVEPSSIFMGRGRHPMRGRWKEGARQHDVTLNLSPDAPRPPGDWDEIVWKPDVLWVARWRDKLSGKLKYVWLGDSAPMKQEREEQKFDQVYELQAELDTVRGRIESDLSSPDEKQRMLATACYLIDHLCLRVGDEKEADEADTVGATTLRPEHVTVYPDGTAEFEFLGKDSVLWHKRISLPPKVLENLEELIGNARPPNSNGNGHPTQDKPQIFPEISSRNVNTYLSSILEGLTAKVFRTHHATIAVQEHLHASGLTGQAPEYEKWKVASLANLEAAILCNHTKQEPASWPRSQERYQQRIAKAKERVAKYRQRVEDYRATLAALRQEAQEKIAAASEDKREKVEARYQKRIDRAEAKVEKATGQLERARHRQGKIEAQLSVAAQKRTWNLGTSLKSYIDPRVYYEWGQQVDYDVLECYYPKKLRSKFSWVRDGSPDEEG